MVVLGEAGGRELEEILWVVVEQQAVVAAAGSGDACSAAEDNSEAAHVAIAVVAVAELGTADLVLAEDTFAFGPAAPDVSNTDLQDIPAAATALHQAASTTVLIQETDLDILAGASVEPNLGIPWAHTVSLGNNRFQATGSGLLVAKTENVLVFVKEPVVVAEVSVFVVVEEGKIRRVEEEEVVGRTLVAVVVVEVVGHTAKVLQVSFGFPLAAFDSNLFV